MIKQIFIAFLFMNIFFSEDIKNEENDEMLEKVGESIADIDSTEFVKSM